jgi:hypothetical protein
MARKKKSSQSITKYLEEKRKRIDPAQLTIVKMVDPEIPPAYKDAIINTKGKVIPKLKKLLQSKDGVVSGTEIIYSNPEDQEKPSIPRRIYNFVFGWILTKKSDSENIFQFGMRQFLPPDSGGKPSWQLLIVLWALVIMSFVTAAEIQVALSWVMTYSDKGQVLTKKMHGFSEAFIYFIMIFGGIVSGLFYKREKDRKVADGTNPAPDAPGMLTALKDRVSSFISKK